MEILDTLSRSQPKEFSFPITSIDGELPTGLDGVLWRNGAGTMQAGEDPLAFLDGYSLLAGLEIADGKAWFRSVYPQTDVLLEEQAAGGMTRRRVFTNLPQRTKNVFNIDPTTAASHDSYVWNGHVHAADLGSHWELSLPEMKTLGRAPWNAGKGQLVAPMPRDDPERGRLVTYLLRQSPLGGALTVVEVDENFNEVERAPTIRLKGLVHDVAFTPNWYVLVENAAKPRPIPALSGSVPLWWAFGWKDVAPSLLLIPRGRPGDVQRIPLDTSLRTVFHVVNAYEDGDRVIADVTGYDGVVPFDVIMPAARGRAPRRTPDNHVARINSTPTSGTATVSFFEEIQGEAPEVAPAVQGRPHRWAWFAAMPAAEPDPFVYTLTHRLAALNTATGEHAFWDAGERHQLTPPAFAPDRAASDPEAGWVLAWDLDLDAETTSVVILDAMDVAAGPVARLHIGEYLPAISHARFSPGTRIGEG